MKVVDATLSLLFSTVTNTHKFDGCLFTNQYRTVCFCDSHYYLSIYLILDANREIQTSFMINHFVPR